MKGLRRLLGGGKPTNGIEDAETERPVPTNDERVERDKYRLDLEHDPTAVFPWSGYICGPLGQKYFVAQSETDVKRQASKWLDAILTTKPKKQIRGSDL